MSLSISLCSSASEQNLTYFCLIKLEMHNIFPWRTNSPQLWIIAISWHKVQECCNIYLREEAAFQDSQWNLVDVNQYHLTNLCKVAQSTQRDPIFLQESIQTWSLKIRTISEIFRQTKTSQGPFVFQFCLIVPRRMILTIEDSWLLLRLLMRPVPDSYFLSSNPFNFSGQGTNMCGL